MRKNQTEHVELTPAIEAQDSEKALLGAMLINPREAAVVEGIAPVEDFYGVAHQWIAQAIYEAGDDADPMAVYKRIEAMGKDNEVSEIKLAELINASPMGLRATAHAHIIADRAERRRVNEALQRILPVVKDLTVDASQLYGVAMDELAKAVRSSVTHHPTIQDVADQAAEMFDRRVEAKGALIGYPTGLIDLDKITQGWQPGRLITIGARPGEGKSVLLMQSALQAAKLGTHVNVYALEMSEAEVYLRMAKHHAMIGYRSGEEYKLTEDQRAKMKWAFRDVSTLPIQIRSTTSVKGIISECDIEHRRDRLGMVIIDQLQNAVPDTGKRNSSTRDAELSAATRSLKQMARRLNVPVVIASALNRTAEGVIPTLSTLRESGGIESDSDIVVFLSKAKNAEGQEIPNTVRFTVAKNRDGEEGRGLIYFHKDQHRMGNGALQR